MTTITDTRLAEMVGAGVPCVPAQPGEIAAVVQELRKLRALPPTPTADQPDTLPGNSPHDSYIATPEAPTPASGEQTIGEALELAHNRKAKMDVVCGTFESELTTQTQDYHFQQGPDGGWLLKVDGWFDLSKCLSPIITAANERAERAEQNYQSAVTGRSNFRQAYRDAKARAETAESLNTTLSEALEETTQLLLDLDQGRYIHNSRFPEQKIDGGLWAQVSRVAKVARTALAALPAKRVGQS